MDDFSAKSHQATGNLALCKKDFTLLPSVELTLKEVELIDQAELNNSYSHGDTKLPCAKHYE